MLDPVRHKLVTLEATLPGFLAVFEHEALVSALVLAAMEHVSIDPTRWPGQDRDGPLYELRAELPPRPAPRTELPAVLETLSWPELERRVAAGGRLAVLPPGAT